MDWGANLRFHGHHQNLLQLQIFATARRLFVDVSYLPRIPTNFFMLFFLGPQLLRHDVHDVTSLEERLLVWNWIDASQVEVIIQLLQLALVLPLTLLLTTSIKNENTLAQIQKKLRRDCWPELMPHKLTLTYLFVANQNPQIKPNQQKCFL